MKLKLSGKGRTGVPTPRRPNRSRPATRVSLWSAGCLLVLLLAGTAPATQRTNTFANESAAFAYGARLDPSGYIPDSAIEVAAGIGLKWIAIPFDWATFWPDSNTPPELSTLDRAMALAEKHEISVLLSLMNAPPWARSEQGPDAALSSELLLHLVLRYPAVKAVELFPGANTSLGWGTAPDPSAYGSMLSVTKEKLQTLPAPPLLVAGGLIPLPPNPQQGDIDDRVYLERLYAAGFGEMLGIVSLHLNDLSGDPLASPREVNQRVLRHYESVRKVMLDQGHQNGMIWITSFSWPSSKMSLEFEDPNLQAKWLHQAYNLFSAQLYIGAAFFDQLNPPSKSSQDNQRVQSLIDPDGSLHPGLRQLGLLSSYENGPAGRELPHKLIKKLYTDKKRLKADL